MIIDGKEWKLVPVEATQAMLDAAEKIDWSGEDVLGNCCNQWYAMLAAAPPAPVVEVTKATCAKVARANVDARLAAAPDEILESATAIEALAWLFKWQQVLVPTIGMVTREELARAVEENGRFREALTEIARSVQLGAGMTYVVRLCSG